MKDTHLLYIILAVFICIGTVSAQTPKWVSTEVQNRAAVLEKFTGGFCTYCADGDRIANNLAEQYSDKFIIVSIHIDMLDASMLYGNYLKTDEGELIYEEATEEYDDLLQLYQSMPVGTINRSTEPWTMSRDKWDSTSVNIMNQSSIVNVYVKPKL
ncbi:MAG: hypothetical protein IJK61_01420, partial [Bacteroidetes bacterium]|nr:hypothetical protein [Bacteroidota bacterium]